MNELINGRTLEETERIIRCHWCSDPDADCEELGCPLDDDPDADCTRIVECGTIALIDCLESRIAELEAEQPRWISVKERPPEFPCLYWDGVNPVRRTDVLGVVTLSSGERAYVTNIDVQEFFSKLYNNGAPDDCTKILYWMPLPEPPEEGSND